MAELILVVNAGSSSLKFSAFESGRDRLELVVRGQIEGLYTSPKFAASDRQGSAVGSKSWPEGTDLGHSGAIEFLGEFLRGHGAGHELAAVGHRVVHGGVRFTEPVRVTPEVVAELAKLNPLAPLHQPHNLKPIEVLSKSRPN